MREYNQQTYAYFTQPIVNINCTKTIVHELLLRVHDAETDQWRLPEDFDIPVEVQIDLIRDVLPSLSTHNVSINLTHNQFRDPHVAECLVNFAKKTPTLTRLTIELVDAPTVAELKAMGPLYTAGNILIAIDDVGSDNLHAETGELLPYVDTIKFALQNLRSKPTDMIDEHAAALQFWMDLAARHHLLFTFEGIENQVDLDLASNLGITRCQGYFYTRPVLPAELPQMFL